MALAPGTRLGPYEIGAQIGKGGMGEVYRALDTNLGRQIAVKILPDEFASDPERVARFEREAKTLASLNHPNIAHIHGLEEFNGMRALVMELVEGNDLSDRIARGPIPIGDALPIARQIAEALEAAHEQGIIHRDLKPANIKVRVDGTVKVLDFGLAKLAQAATGGTVASATMSPTITSPAMMTGVGMLLGTAAYMSPEQARGKEADKRSDIWAFGCVLFEMLTGKRVFDADGVADTLAHVLTKEPDWSLLPQNNALRRLLRRCLDKNRQARLAAIADVRFDLDEAAAPAPVDEGYNIVARTPVRRVLFVMLAAGIAVALTAGTWRILMAERRATIPPVRALMSLGADANVVNQGAALALSPDGELLAFVATPSSSNVSQLFVRRIAQLQATMLAGTVGARDPFFSPDGKWIGFFADAKLKKVAVTGGAVVALCDVVNARGGAWADEGWIVFQPQGQGAPLLRVPSAGGTPTPLGSLQSGETTQRWPQVLPGGKGVLYTSHNRPAGFDDANIVVQPLPNGAAKIIQRGAYFGRYVPSGHLLFMRSGTLFAVTFDLARLEISGDPVPVLEGLASTPTAAGVNGTGQFAVSDAGTLVFLPGNAAVEPVLPVDWIDRTGKVTSLRATPSLWRDLRFAPDGRRLAMSIQDSSPQTDVWIYEWRRDAISRLTFDPADDIAPVWTPDGERIAFASRRGDPNGPANLYWQRADGTGEVQRLTQSSRNQLPGSWHPTGRFLAFMENSNNAGDVMILPMDGNEASGWKPGQPMAFVNSTENEQAPTFSPDGRWIAYSSTESGAPEVFVRPFPGPGGKWQLSVGGGQYPVWSTGKRELFYQTLDDRVMVVPYTVAGNSVVPDKPYAWSERRLALRPGNGRGFAVTADGERIAGAVAVDKPTTTQDKVVFVSDFFDELIAAVPTKKR